MATFYSIQRKLIIQTIYKRLKDIVKILGYQLEYISTDEEAELVEEFNESIEEI